MLISFAEHAVELQSWDTKDELLNYVTRCSDDMIVLGEEAEQEVEFYSAIVYISYSARVREDARESKFGIALCSEGHGVKPQLALLPDKILAVGLNNEAVGISVDDRHILFRLVFDSLFRSFFYLDDLKILLVLNEIGVIAITEEGEELWRYEKDVVTDYLVSQGHLHMKFMDSPSVKLSLVSGAIR